jgi:hypothetical protein
VFYIRADDGADLRIASAVNLTVSNCCGTALGPVRVVDFSDGGRVDFTWRRVVVPFAALVAATADAAHRAWDMSDVEWITFYGVTTPMLLDEITIIEVAPAGLSPTIQPSPVGASALRAVAVLRNPVTATSPVVTAGVLFPDAAFACGDGGQCMVLNPATQTWVPDVTPGAAAGLALRGMWAYGTADGAASAVWVVGKGGLIMSRDGADCRSFVRASGASTTMSSADFAALDAAGESAWVVSSAGTAAAGGRTLRAVSGAQRGNGVAAVLFAVGDSGTGLVFAFADNGGVKGSWTSTRTGTSSNLHGVAAFGAGRAVAVGANGTVLVWTNTNAAGATAALDADPVAAEAPSLGSRRATALLGVGNWTLLTRPSRAALAGIDVSAHTLLGVAVVAELPNAVEIVGSGGLLLTIDFSTSPPAWRSYGTGVTSDLTAISGVNAVGLGGVLLTRSWDWQATDVWVPAGNATEWASSGVGAVDLYALDGHATCLDFAREAPRAGSGGGSAIELRADNWHRSQLAMYCGGRDRVLFTPYNTLEFFIKRTNGRHAYPQLQVNTWNLASNTVPVAKYIVGPPASRAEGVTGAWKRVRVSLTDMATHDFLLWGIEFISFANTSMACGENGPYRDTHVECDTYLIEGVTLIDDPALPAPAMSPSNNFTRSPVSVPLRAVASHMGLP